jgi:putative hydrolase of the HAD superfamily
MASHPSADSLNLIFDADDTLWHSNIHFLEAEAAFIQLLYGRGLTDHVEIRGALRRHELSIIADIGYGRGPYVTALQRVVLELLPSDHHQSVQLEVERLGARLLGRTCELLPGVESTLRDLAQRHRLLLFTKGQPEEQLAKLERSGLRSLFNRVGIPIEKDATTYRLLVAQADLDSSRTVMIGNSPRSDINPALKAGLRAVYIPHPHTWELEHEEVDHGDDRLLVLASFPRLLDIF